MDELTEFDKIAWSDFGRRVAAARRAAARMGRSTNRLERFWTPERLGDGARSARARMALVNLTLSAIGKNKKPRRRIGPVGRRGHRRPGNIHSTTCTSRGYSPRTLKAAVRLAAVLNRALQL